MTSTAVAISGAREEHRGWLLLILLGGVFMTTADNSIVNVAIPSIASDLRASGGTLELVVAGYILAYAVLLVTGARLGSLFGYRRVFLSGLALFTFASLACGLTSSPATLIAARVLQGIGAGIMVPQVLTGVQLSFNGVDRVRALALYPVALAGGAVAGQALSGVLISLNVGGSSWHSIFLINVPVGVALLTLGVLRLPDDPAPGRKGFDLGGVVALTVAILLLVLPVMLGRDQGWPAWTWLSLLLSAPAFVLFLGIEQRVARRGGQPLLQLELFRSAAVSWGLAAQAAATVTYAALGFVLALYLQHGLGKSPLYAGSILIAWIVGFALSGPVLRSVPEHSHQRVAPIGFGLLGLAFLGIALDGLVAAPQDAPLLVLLGFGGLGMGIGFSALIGHLTTTVRRELASDLSGVLSTNSEVAAALGVTAFGTIYLALAHKGSTVTSVHALTCVCALLAASALLAAAAAHRATAPSRNG